jgi:hypothetical protein
MMLRRTSLEPPSGGVGAHAVEYLSHVAIGHRRFRWLPIRRVLLESDTVTMPLSFGECRVHTSQALGHSRIFLLL